MDPIETYGLEIPITMNIRMQLKVSIKTEIDLMRII
jgi:hypothetical protein